MHIGYIITIAFLVIYFVFKFIEGVKARKAEAEELERKAAEIAEDIIIINSNSEE